MDESEQRISECSIEEDVEDSSNDLSDFSDTEFNLDNSDLFCDGEDIEEVKKHVEHSLRDLSIFGAEFMDIDESDGQIESDELLTASESSDDESTPQNKYPHFNEMTGFSKQIELEKGMQFRNKHIFNKALRYYAVMKGFDFYYVRNGKTKVSVHCKTVHCTWRVLASWFSDGKGGRSFMIKTWIPHKDKSCPRRFENSKVSVKFLTEYYLEDFRNNPKWEAPAFFKHVKADLEVNVSRMKCFRARQNALKIIDGSVGEQFKLLRQYCGAVLKWCPGSTILLKTDGVHFQRIYICLDACKRGFLKGCRPIISLDSCHLKGHYNGQIHSAVGRDANDNMFPIAWAVCEAESKETWTWFLQALINDIGFPTQHNWCFISDQQKGLQEALKDIIPEGEHRSCVRHIYANFKKKFKGKELKDAMWAAARATTKGQFNEKMEVLKDLDVASHLHMTTFDPKSWSRHAFKFFSRSDALCSNISECFNSYIKDARECPIITCLETIRLLLMKRFQEKYSGMINYGYGIMPRPLKKLEEHKKNSLHLQVSWNGRGMGFQVARNVWDGHVVDLESYTCDCNLWDLTGIPCVHACAAIFHINGNPDNYVHHSLKKENFIKAYEASINHMPGPTEWPQVDGGIVLPPLFRKQPGRPRKKRIREVDEPVNPHRVKRGGTKIKCSNCGKVGHNRKRCKDEPSDSKRATQGAKDAERKKIARQLKKVRLEGSQPYKSNLSPPKKPKDKRKHKDPPLSHMRGSQASNQVPPTSEWTIGYETSGSAITYRPPQHAGPIYIGGGMFTGPRASTLQDRAGSNTFQGTSPSHE